MLPSKDVNERSWAFTQSGHLGYFYLWELVTTDPEKKLWLVPLISKLRKTLPMDLCPGDPVILKPQVTQPVYLTHDPWKHMLNSNPLPRLCTIILWGSWVSIALDQQPSCVAWQAALTSEMLSYFHHWWLLPTSSSCPWTTKHSSPPVQPIKRTKWQQSRPTAAWHWFWQIVGIWQINGLTRLWVSSQGKESHRFRQTAWPCRSFHPPDSLPASSSTSCFPPPLLRLGHRNSPHSKPAEDSDQWEAVCLSPPHPLGHPIIQEEGSGGLTDEKKIILLSCTPDAMEHRQAPLLSINPALTFQGPLGCDSNIWAEQQPVKNMPAKASCSLLVAINLHIPSFQDRQREHR